MQSWKPCISLALLNSESGSLAREVEHEFGWLSAQGWDFTVIELSTALANVYSGLWLVIQAPKGAEDGGERN